MVLNQDGELVAPEAWQYQAIHQHLAKVPMPVVIKLDPDAVTRVYSLMSQSQGIDDNVYQMAVIIGGK